MSDPKAQQNDKLPTEYQLRLAAVQKLEAEWKQKHGERQALYQWIVIAIDHHSARFGPGPEGAKKFRTTLVDAINAITESQAAGFYAEAVAGSGVRGSGVGEPGPTVLDSGHASLTDSGTTGEHRSSDNTAAGPDSEPSTGTGSNDT